MCPYTLPRTQHSGLLTSARATGLSYVGVYSGLSSCPRPPSPRFWTLPDLSLALLLPSLTGHLRAKGLSSPGGPVAAVPHRDDADSSSLWELCLESWESDSALCLESVFSPMPGAFGQAAHLPLMEPEEAALLVAAGGTRRQEPGPRDAPGGGRRPDSEPRPT